MIYEIVLTRASNGALVAGLVQWFGPMAQTCLVSKQFEFLKAGC